MIAGKMTGFPSPAWRYPLAGMDQMARQMDWLANGMFGRQRGPLFPAKVFPAVNISEDKDHYYVRAELSGIKKDDFHLEVTGRNLTISGERQIQPEDKNARYHRRERDAGKFSRIIRLPAEVDVESVNAAMTDGVLTVTIAKAEASKPKKIPVR